MERMSYTLAEVANMTGLYEDVLRRHIKKHKIATAMVGNSMLIPAETVTQMLTPDPPPTPAPDAPQACPEPAEAACVTCRFGKAARAFPQYVECRRRPAAVISGAYYRPVTPHETFAYATFNATMFPIMANDEWCGEWEARQKSDYVGV